MAQATLTSSRTDKTFYTVNVRLLVATIVVTILAAGLGYVWYQYQAGRTANVVLERAQKLEKEAKWGEASAYYQKYLLADPENTEVLVQLIGVQNRGEPSPAKLYGLNNLLYRTLGRLPEREDLRLMLAENLLKTGAWEEAEAEADKLKQAAPEIARKARKVVAVSRLRRLDVDHTISVAETLKELTSIAEELPSDYELALITAVAVRSRGKEVPELGDPATLADHLVDQAVAAQPESAEALMTRYGYRQLYSLPGADEDLAAALKIEPDNTDAMFASALSRISPQSSASDLEAANKSLRDVIAAAPENLQAYLALVEVLKRQGRTDEAIRLLQDIAGRVDEKFQLQLVLANLQLEAKQVDDARSTLDGLQRDSTTYLARLEAGQRDHLEKRLRLLGARIDLAQQKIDPAVGTLKSVYLGEDALDTAEPSAEWIQACQLLAAIYQQEGAWDQAGTYWDALLKVHPGNSGLVEPAVEAALRAGNGNRAIEILDRYERTAALTENLQVLRVQTLLLAEMQRPLEQRNWAEFDQALQAALVKSPDRPELLFAQIERLKPDSEEKEHVLELLRDGEKRFEKNKDFWRGAVLQYAQLEAIEDQERALARYRELEPTQVEKSLIEAAVLVQNNKFADADHLLADVAGSLPKDQQTILALRRIETLAQHGEIKQASELANKLLNADASNLKLLKLGAELALAVGNSEAAEKWEQKLAADTANGPDAQALKVKRLLVDYANLSVEERQQLADTINAVRSERPEWFEIVSLAGRFAELSGDQRQAVEDYRLAVSLGDRRQFTLEQLVRLLYGLNSFEEAAQYLTILASDQSASDFVNSMGVQIARKGGRQTGVISAARQNVELYPQDATRRIFLANLLLANGEPREAEAVLRQASQDLPADPRIWLGLVSYLAQSNRPSDAAVIMTAIENSTAIDAKDRHALLARGYDLVGDHGAAAKNYQAALEQDSENVQLRLAFARSLRTRSVSDAITQYQKVLQLAPANSEAQNELAIVLASTGNPEDWARASKLLEADEPSSANRGNSHVLLRALLLSQQGRTRAERVAKCQAASQLLNQYLQTVGAVDADLVRLMLAQIIEQEATLSGQTSRLVDAREQLQKVVEGKSPTIEQQSRYIEFLIRNADKVEEKSQFLEAAGQQLATLRESLSADDTNTAALGVALAAQLSQAQGHEDKANEVIEAFAREHLPEKVDNKAIPTLLTIGKLYNVAGNHAAAEKTYREIQQLAPNAYVLVVQSLLEQDKRREAAQLCLDLSPAGLSPETAQTLASALATPEGEDNLEFPEAEAALQVALEKYSTNVGLLQAEAIREASRGDYPAAIAAFRKLVEIDPQNSLALNNLATLLAENPNLREEALQVIQQAIQFAGRQPSLLDTKGTILLKLSRPDEAITDLEEATAGGIADARYYLHLAAAYHLAQRDAEAIKMLDEAFGFGLDKFLLTGDDRQFLEQLNSLKNAAAEPAGAST